MANGDCPNVAGRPSALATSDIRTFRTAEIVFASHIGLWAHCSRRMRVLRRAASRGSLTLRGLLMPNGPGGHSDLRQRTRDLFELQPNDMLTRLPRIT